MSKLFPAKLHPHRELKELFERVYLFFISIHQEAELLCTISLKWSTVYELSVANDITLYIKNLIVIFFSRIAGWNPSS